MRRSEKAVSNAPRQELGLWFADKDQLHLQTAPQVPAILRFMQPMLASGWRIRYHGVVFEKVSASFMLHLRIVRPRHLSELRFGKNQSNIQRTR